MAWRAGLEPARTASTATSPCLLYSESHGAERYNSRSSHGGLRLRSGRGGAKPARQNPRVKNPRSRNAAPPPTAISPALTLQEIPLSFAFFRVSSPPPPSSPPAITPGSVCLFRQRHMKSEMSGRGLPAPPFSAPDAPAPPSGEPLRPLTAGQSERCRCTVRDSNPRPCCNALRGLLFAPAAFAKGLRGPVPNPDSADTITLYRLS